MSVKKKNPKISRVVLPAAKQLALSIQTQSELKLKMLKLFTSNFFFFFKLGRFERPSSECLFRSFVTQLSCR